MAVTELGPITRARKKTGGNSPFLGPVVREFPVQPKRNLTARRPGGVGQPAATTLRGPVARSTAALLSEAIDFALESLNRLERQAGEVARRIRTSARAGHDAGEGLRDLMHSTQTVMKLASLSANFAGIDLEALCVANGVNPEAETTAAMNELVWHQMSEDRFAVAATLERSFATALEAWRQLFVALGPSPAGPSGFAA